MSVTPHKMVLSGGDWIMNSPAAHPFETKSKAFADKQIVKHAKQK
jgi:hypothetical protein